MRGNGAKVLVEFEKKILDGGIFLKIGGDWANVLVEFKKKNFNWGHFFFKLGAFFLKLGQKIILGSRN